MNKQQLLMSAKKVKKKIIRKSPIILSAVGISGMYISVASAIKATPKALALIDLHREREEKGFEDPLTRIDIVKLTWKCYIPTAIMLGISTACLIGANTANGRQKAALATAYALSETALHEYKDKVVNFVGAEKAQKIKEAVAQEKIDKKPLKDKEVIVTAKGENLCFEPLTSRYFKTSIEDLERSANELNKRMRSENSISVNDWFETIGLKTVEGCVGEDAGWNIDTGYIEISLAPAIADDGSPCLVIVYDNPPRYDYYI